MLNNGDAHLQTTLNRHRSLTKVASQSALRRPAGK